MFKTVVFLLASTTITFGNPVADTADGCLSYVEIRLETLLATHVSIRDTMCELLQDFAQCVYKASNRRLSAVENAKFVRLVELALDNSGETAKACQIDVNGVTGGGENMTERERQITDEATAKVQLCISNFSDQIVKIMKSKVTTACQILDNTLLCILTAIPRRPTASEIDAVESIISAAMPSEIRPGCDVDLKSMVKQRWWTAKDCISDAQNHFKELLALNDSIAIQDGVCDINQDLISCVNLTEKRRLTIEENAAFLKFLSEGALATIGETVTVCGSNDFNFSVTTGVGGGDGGFDGTESTTDPSVAETTQDCANAVKSRLESLLARGDSINEVMCDLNQDHASCVYMAANRRRSNDETSEFVSLVEDALQKAGETGKICEIDWDAIKSGGAGADDQTSEEEEALNKCLTEFTQTVSQMANRGSEVSDEEYCDAKNKVIQCVLSAMNRRPTQEEIDVYSEQLEAAELQIGKRCEIDLNAKVDEYWKRRSGGDNGAEKRSPQMFYVVCFGWFLYQRLFTR